MITLKPTTANVICPYIAIMKEEHLNIPPDTSKYNFLEICLNDVFIGFRAYKLTGKTAYLKLFWILPEYRHKGHGTRALLITLKYLKALGVHRIHAIATPASLPLYKKLHATIGQQYKNKMTRVSLTL